MEITPLSIHLLFSRKSTLYFFSVVSFYIHTRIATLKSCRNIVQRFPLTQVPIITSQSINLCFSLLHTHLNNRTRRLHFTRCLVNTTLTDAIQYTRVFFAARRASITRSPSRPGRTQRLGLG